jgi:hypothetical protein
VRLSAERLDVVLGDRIRGVLFVSLEQAEEDVIELLEDIGFEDVKIYREPPSTWPAADDAPPTSLMEWRLWFEGVANRTASYRRDLSAEVRVVRAWQVGVEAPFSKRPRPVCLLHPYAVRPCPPARFVYVHVFGVAYPLVGAP